MEPRSRWIALLVACAVMGGVRAQEVPTGDEYLRRIKIYQTIQPVGDTPFGERLNLYTGDLTFSQTDISLEGSGPTITLVRQLASMAESESRLQPYMMGDWVLSIPRIETVVSANLMTGDPGQPGDRWMVISSSDPNRHKRCTYFGRPVASPGFGFNGSVWAGVEMVTEDGQRQTFLKRSVQNTSAPVMTDSLGQPIAFPVVTQDNWQIGCLAQTSNGQTGEAFLAVSPSGTKYWFNHLVGERIASLAEPVEGGAKIKYPRMMVTMYVTRIEDRVGNALTYQYNGDRLASITATDGRSVSITWRPDARLISGVTVQASDAPARAWQYSYATVSSFPFFKLATVTLPDNTSWTFNLNGLGGWPLEVPNNEECTQRIPTGLLPGNGLVSTVTAPSGAVGSFTISGVGHTRSYVPNPCQMVFATSALTRKEIAGPGVAPSVWTYSYFANPASFSADACYSAGTCAATKTVQVTSPTGDMTRYTYSNRWNETEGKLMKMESFQGSATLVRTETYTYANPTQGPFPYPLGSSFEGSSSNAVKNEVWTPMREQITTQQGRNFVMTVQSFDGRARPTSVTRSSSPIP
ncbi:hypothetical protein [Pseudoxanthomonas sp.]|uniref:hypothetical protein n=1 Tax=Pseudoxanthomonas sp. TaxID=1871049 RepID=UPI003F7D159D